MLETSPESAQREILWNVSSLADQVALYSFLVVAALICLNGLVHRFILWTNGRPDPSRLRALGKRFKDLWREAFLQRGTNRSPSPRVFHTLIVWGFMVLLFTTTMVFLDHDLGLDIYRGRFYLAVTVLSDLFGLGLLIGVLLAARRRYATAPDFLHSSRSDGILLGGLALLVVQGFLLEALRIHVTVDPWALYSPVGYALSLFFWDLSPAAARLLHYSTWWFHTLTVFAAIAVVPYTKFFHIVSSSANLFFRERGRHKGALSFPGRIEELMEKAMETEGGEFRIGVSTLTDLSWKQLLDLDACTSCGRCQAVCPAYRSQKVLSPKWLILDTRNHMLHLHRRGELNGKSPESNGSALFRWSKELDSFLLRSLLVAQTPAVEVPPDAAQLPLERRGENKAAQQAALSVGLSPTARLAGEVMDENVFWSCTTCRACVEVCPVGIEHVDYIVETRRSLALMEGNIPTEAQASLRAIETRGNPFGPAEDRAKWIEGLDVPVLEPGAEVDVLYWVGCLSAFDKRKQLIARSLVKILGAAKLKWGILGNRESCTGDPARRLGEENLFQSQAMKNIELLTSIKFKTLVTNCPHCFHTFKNEYPALQEKFLAADANGNAPRVIHHSHLIRELLETGKLSPTKSLDTEITFHDPCYLARYNDTYDEPRDVLVQLGASKLHEMKSNREKGLCCGAGGGHFFMDLKQGERVNVIRVNEAAETPAKTIATGCPFCMHMLDDGLKLTNKDEEMKVRDIAELVADAL